MKIFVIGDLHLGFSVEKPMDIFGGNWENHFEKIKENWENNVANDDIVVICGDISWALKTDEAISDLEFIDKLPGKKIIMKGNHDLWWQSMSKNDALIRTKGFETLKFLYNDAVYIEEAGVAVCGSRGWKTPIDDGFTEDDAKVWRRELMRLEASIQKARTFTDNIVAVMHFPPFNIAKREANEMIELLKKYNIKRCYFGHVHNLGAAKFNEEGEIQPIFKKNNIEYYLVASDFVNFKPIEIKL